MVRIRFISHSLRRKDDSQAEKWRCFLQRSQSQPSKFFLYSINSLGLRMLLGYLPASGTEIVQALLKPSISWPIPVLRRKVISVIRTIIDSALQKNQFP
jgi:hypothetical protein